MKCSISKARCFKSATTYCGARLLSFELYLARGLTTMNYSAKHRSSYSNLERFVKISVSLSLLPVGCSRGPRTLSTGKIRGENGLRVTPLASRKESREKGAWLLPIKSLPRFCCAGTMDRVQMKENECTGACHLQGTMMHSHGRCIKVVYAREEDHPLSDLARVCSLSLCSSWTETDYEGSKTFKSITSHSCLASGLSYLRLAAENCFPLFVGKINHVSTGRVWILHGRCSSRRVRAHWKNGTSKTKWVIHSSFC